MDKNELTLVEHLAELRKRLFIIFGAALLGAIICYSYIDKIINLVIKPAKGLEFVYLTPPELFLAYVKLALILGVAVSSPIIILQIWLFINPGLTKQEKSYLVISLIAGVVFFAVGILFAYLIILPLTIDFFIKLKVEGIEPMFSFGSYVGFVNSILLAFGLVFEMPILVFFLAKLKLITSKTLRKNRKIFLLVIVIVAALLTPPDVVSQMLLAAPMLILFEISILLASLVNKG